MLSSVDAGLMSVMVLIKSFIPPFIFVLYLSMANICPKQIRVNQLIPVHWLITSRE